MFHCSLVEPTTDRAGECYVLLLCVHWDEMSVSVYLAWGTLCYSRYDNSRVIVAEPSPALLWPLHVHYDRFVYVCALMWFSQAYLKLQKVVMPCNLLIEFVSFKLDVEVFLKGVDKKSVKS